jgi:cell wall-associated NlpC family hydrolase
MRSLPRLPEETRAAFLAAARAYVGVRWRHQGRNSRGVDCIGLVAAALKDCGIEGNDDRSYERVPDGIRLRAGLTERFGEPVLQWRPGDVVLMRWATTNGLESHVGILATFNDQWTLLHAFAGERRVVEHRLAGEWMRRVADVFSLTGAP